MYGNGLVEFWEFWGVSMNRTTVMLTDRIRKRVCRALLVGHRPVNVKRAVIG